MKAIKTYIKPFEAPQRSVKMKIKLNYFFSFGIGTGKIKYELRSFFAKAVNSL